jgi:arsenate reductase
MKESITVYHNSRCRKSRAGLDYTREKGMDPTVREYLKDLLSIEELKKLLMKLNIPASALVRTQEEYFKKELKGLKLTEEEWIRELEANPKLIRRPIVEGKYKAVIGDPVENIDQL